LECDKSDAAIFIGQVWPDDVVENVGFDGVDGGGKSCQTFWPGCACETCCVDDEAGEMV
jgi:hypothetical protein